CACVQCGVNRVQGGKICERCWNHGDFELDNLIYKHGLWLLCACGSVFRISYSSRHDYGDKCRTCYTSARALLKKKWLETNPVPTNAVYKLEEPYGWPRKLNNHYRWSLVHYENTCVC